MVVIEPTVFGDARGYFMETYNQKEFREAGLKCRITNQSQAKGFYGGSIFNGITPRGSW